MAKAAVRKAPATPDILVCECPMFIHFSREVIEDRETFRRLAHRAVDLAVGNDGHRLVCACVAESLEYIGREYVTEMVTNLVHEVWGEG